MPRTHSIRITEKDLRVLQYYKLDNKCRSYSHAIQHAIERTKDDGS